MQIERHTSDPAAADLWLGPRPLPPRNDQDLQAFYSLMTATTRVMETPAFGGLDPNHPGDPLFNYYYNSAPYGACKRINLICTGLFSHLTGCPHLGISTDRHVTTAVQLSRRWWLMDVYSGGSLLGDPGEKTPALFPMERVCHRGPEEADPWVWGGARAALEPYFTNCRSFAGIPPVVTPGWLFPRLTLPAAARTEVVASDLNPLDLVDYPNFEFVDYLAQSQAPPIVDLLEGRRRVAAEERVPLFRARFPLDRVGDRLELDWPLMISRVTLAAGAPGEIAGGDVYQVMGHRFLRVRPQAPAWSLDWARLRPRPVPANGSLEPARDYLGPTAWHLLSGRAEINRHFLLLTAGEGPARMQLAADYRNDSGEWQYLWLPLVYRTETPLDPGGSILGSFRVQGRNTQDIYAWTGAKKLANVVAPLAPGQDLDLELYLNPGCAMSIYGLGVVTDVKDCLAPKSPALSLAIDCRGIEESWRRRLTLQVEAMLNPGFIDS